jgi:hypothetical protein
MTTKLLKWQENIFDIVMYITYFLYIILALGISGSAPEYLQTLDYYMKLYVSLFLIIRFNPFTRVKFTRLDAKIAFSAGLFVLATTTINTILKHFKDIILETIRTFIKYFFPSFVPLT